MKISVRLFRLFIYRANQPSQSAAERRGGANGRLSRRDLERRILDVFARNGGALERAPSLSDLP